MMPRLDFAPLDGITKVVFRRVWHRHFGGADRYFIPFFSPTDQHILTQRDGEDAGAEAQAYLEDNGLQQTMTVECLGDPELISGSAVLLRANTTGVTGLCWIDSDTHTWKNGQYFCRLSLNFRSLTNEVEAGQEV